MSINYNEIGANLAKRRKELNLTQAAIAEAADISNNFLSDLERGVSVPSLETVMALSIALDTTPDEFLASTAHADGDNEWRSVAQLLRGMDEKHLSMARSMLIWLSEQELQEQ